MDKIKKILTTPQFANYLWEVNSEICGDIPTEYDVRSKLKELGVGKKFLAEYADTYYLMSVINYVSNSEYDEEYVWKDKDKLIIEQSNKGQIEFRRRAILTSLRELNKYGEVDEETMNSILATLNIEEEKEDDDENILNAIFK